MQSVAFADDLVKEYLLFRGCPRTAATFESEKRASKLRGGFQVAKVLEQLFSYVYGGNLSALLELWDYLHRHFFSRLDKDFSVTVRKLEQSLKRFYVVQCCVNGHPERVEEFFQQLSGDLLRDAEWRPWFALRYVRNPAADPVFEVYFTRAWAEAFTVSLQNFLATIFQSVPLPRLLNFNAARLSQKSLEHEVETLAGEVKRLKELVENAELQLEVYRRKDRDQQQQQQQQPTPLPAQPQPTTPPTPPASHSAAVPRMQSVFSAQRDLLFDGAVDDGPVSAQWTRYDGRSTEPPPAVPLLGGARDSAAELEEPFLVAGCEMVSGFSGPVRRVRFSPDGTYCAAASETAVRVWGSRPPVAVAFQPLAEVSALAWASDKLLLIGSVTGRIRQFSVPNQALVAELPVPSSEPVRIDDLSVSPSGAVLLCAANCAAPDRDDGVLFVFSLKAPMRVERRISVERSSVRCLAWNHNSTLCAVGTGDGFVRVFDMVACSSLLGWHANDGPVLAVQWAPDELSVFTAGADAVVQWSYQSVGRKERTFPATQSADRSDIAFDGDRGRFFVVPTANGAALYRTDASRPVQVVTSRRVLCVDWHRSMRIATGSEDCLTITTLAQ